LGTYSGDEYNIAEGLLDLEQRDSEYKLTSGITNVTVDITDFVLFTVKVDFLIPDISQFEDFKKMWLDFGLQCELEWGRARNFEDLSEKSSPDKQKMEGIISYFDYQYQSNRTIKGTLTIYSKTALTQMRGGIMEKEEMNIFKEVVKQSLFDKVLTSQTENIEVNVKNDYSYVSMKKESINNIKRESKLIENKKIRGKIIRDDDFTPNTTIYNYTGFSDYSKIFYPKGIEEVDTDFKQQQKDNNINELVKKRDEERT